MILQNELENAPAVLYLKRFPVVGRLLDALAEEAAEMNVNQCAEGLEIHPFNEVNGMPNRAYLRIFYPVYNKCVLLFYKKSSIPFSRDRFSYGGLVIDERSTMRFSEEDIREWVDFLVSGLQPGLKPRQLKKSIPYTVPED